MAVDGIPRRSSHILLRLIIHRVYPGNTLIRERSEKKKTPTGIESRRDGDAGRIDFEGGLDMQNVWIRF